jgi:hypothetical protein
VVHFHTGTGEIISTGDIERLGFLTVQLELSIDGNTLTMISEESETDYAKLSEGDSGVGTYGNFIDLRALIDLFH